MIELALEIPKPHLDEFMPECELGFALAHECLKSPSYANYYKQLDMDVLLDNGIIETGTAMNTPQLWRMVNRVQPKAVIPPDELYNLTFGLMCRDQMLKTIPDTLHTTQLGFVVQGNTLGERVFALHNAVINCCNPICLPYRTNRVETFQTWINIHGLTDSHIHHIPWIHLLGLRNFTELAYWRHLSSFIRISIDTGKVFNVPAVDFALGNFEVISKDKNRSLNHELSETELSNAHSNIKVLKDRLC